ncbi:MAG: acyl-CoA dehydrogenase C-terminal domain-containing protein [Croceibacterium sp.]
MPIYNPPVRDVRFILSEVLRLDERLPSLDNDLVTSILEQAGRFSAEVIAPLNQTGDRAGCTRHPDGRVTTPPGYREAYRQYQQSGWGTLALPEEYGGQGLPHVLATAVQEFLNSACHAFNMYPGLTHGAVAALIAKGSPDLQAAYLPKLVSGEWIGTMALTEERAGTDLGLIKTRAVPTGDDTFMIQGEKIFCSGGEHDLTDNIVHLVLAKLPGAPAGARGISLFLVPKILPNGERNAVTCGSIEHKMGVHGSATCVMNFDEAAGWLVGDENDGLAAMFIMMNAARLSCGNQGLAQAELAYQNAAAYAQERLQGRAPGSSVDAEPIIRHADVRRMLMDARTFTEGFRALVLWTALQIDICHTAATAEARDTAEALVSLLTPVIKGYGTDKGFQTAVAMQQVFGGHGYIGEWGMEQIVRDARVTMIYEGANGVQALDLVARKILRDGGQAAEHFFAIVEADCEAGPDYIGGPLRTALVDARAAVRWLLQNAAADRDNLGAASYPFMELMGTLALGWSWLRIAQVSEVSLRAGEGDRAFYEAKVGVSRYCAARTLTDIASLRRKVESGAETLMALSANQFAPH